MALLSGVAAMLGGCDDGATGGADGGSAAGTTRGTACLATAELQCDRLLNCNLTFTDRDLCASQIVRRCCTQAGDCEDSLNPIEAEGFAECRAAIAAADCDAVSSPQEACVARGAGL